MQIAQGSAAASKVQPGRSLHSGAIRGAHPTPVAPGITASGFPLFGCPRQVHIDWFLASGMSIEAMIHPTGIRLAHGVRGEDGRFEVDGGGAEWFAIDVFNAFGEQIDVAFWSPKTGEMATWSGRAFALGEHLIDDPWTYSFDCSLNIFTEPLSWLRRERNGIVILNPALAFDRLRDVPRIACRDVPHGQQLRAMLKPSRLPEIYVELSDRRAAA